MNMSKLKDKAKDKDSSSSELSDVDTETTIEEGQPDVRPKEYPEKLVVEVPEKPPKYVEEEDDEKLPLLPSRSESDYADYERAQTQPRRSMQRDAAMYPPSSSEPTPQAPRRKHRSKGRKSMDPVDQYGKKRPSTDSLSSSVKEKIRDAARQTGNPRRSATVSPPRELEPPDVRPRDDSNGPPPPKDKKMLQPPTKETRKDYEKRTPELKKKLPPRDKDEAVRESQGLTAEDLDKFAQKFPEDTDQYLDPLLYPDFMGKMQEDVYDDDDIKKKRKKKEEAENEENEMRDFWAGIKEPLKHVRDDEIKLFDPDAKSQHSSDKYAALYRRVSSTVYFLQFL